VPSRLLCIELTESAILSGPDSAHAVLRQLHEIGVRLSVDDCGTGYSSMAYLKILPVDELKVDRSFVMDLTTNASDTVLVQRAIAAPAANPRRPSDEPDSTNAWSDARPLWRTVCS
jgi:diguanylate cyclase